MAHYDTRFIRKKTHTNHFFYAISHHYHAYKISIINILVTQVVRVSDDDHLEHVLKYLEDVFKMNGYNKTNLIGKY